MSKQRKELIVNADTKSKEWIHDGYIACKNAPLSANYDHTILLPSNSYLAWRISLALTLNLQTIN